MKTRLHKFLSVFLVAMMLLTAAPLSGFVGLEFNLDWLNFTTKVSAEELSGTCGDNLTWSLDTETGELVITGTGAMCDYNYDYWGNNCAPWYSYHSSIKSVSISDGVTTIGNYAFYFCTGLTSATIPNSVTTIGVSSFENCTGLTSVAIPDSVTTIEHRAFYECTGLTNVTISDSVTSIGYYAFYYCIGLTTVTIGKDVTTIGNYAFYMCNSLTSITIPDSVTTIGNYAFFDCDNLTNVTIPDSVFSIRDYAFSQCENLKNVYYLGSQEQCGLINIDSGNDIFFEATFYFHDAVGGYFGDDLIWAFYSDGELRVTGTGAMYDYGSDNRPWESYEDEIKSVTIGDGVTTIGSYAFYDCDRLAYVTVPESVTSFGNYVFYGCNNIVFELKKASYAETFAIDNDIPYIYIYDGSEEKIITKTVTSKLSFEINKETNTMTINCTGDMLSFVNDDAPWVQYKPYIKHIILEDGCTSISDNAFKNFGSIESIIIPVTLTTIGSYSFFCCSNLMGVTIPKNVTSIGNYAFSNCTRLTGIAIPSGVTTIGTYTFYSCDGLEYISIPDSVITIGSYAFYNCSNLTRVRIPDSVASVDAFAFNGCTGLSELSMPVSANISSFAFRYCTGIKKINLTKGYGIVRNYTSSNYDYLPWFESSEDFIEVIFVDGVTGIGDYMFYGCANLNNIALPLSVQSIGNNVFTGCQSMKKLTVNNPDCSFGTDATSYYTTIVGYAGSTAEAYANEMGFDFELIEPCDHKNYHTERNEPTCTEEGLEKSVCDDCGSTFYYAELPKTGHTLETVVANPTCQSAGMVAYYCKVCKYSYIAEITDPVDHDMSWVVVSKPTSSADGEMHYKCSYCDLVEQTKVVPAFMIASNSIANINFETNTISGFDAGATSIDDYVSVETDGYSFVCDSDVIGTGTVIELTDGETVINEFTAVIFGDVNGDGWYDGTDSIIVSCLANGMLSKDDVSPAFYEAADCNHDGVIDSFDVALLEQAGLLLANVDQSKSAEELTTDEAYIEYLDLIDQTPEEEIEDEVIETPEEQPEAESFNIFDFIVEIIKKFVDLILSRIPVPYK